MIVIFSTYQSIEVIMKVQKTLNKKQTGSCIFDLIICDEAHRTTGVVLKDSDESAFVKVHNNDNINAKKRMYMTATPRIYSDDSKQKAQENDSILCSMNDPEFYGDEIYHIGFGEAVEKQLLSDYKVIVLTLDENQLSPALQQSIAAIDGEIKTDDALKLIGCINALSKITNSDKEIFTGIDPEPMHSAVAFCQSIKISKNTQDAMNKCIAAYKKTLTTEENSKIVEVEADHVDGTMGATERNKKLQWLKDSKGKQNKCNILMNVRCLSEGVDVPSLDAVMFLSAKNSQIDVVQSVGRVMRRAEGKKYGYIIIPVVIPSYIEPEKVLDDNERFKIVWTILNALRAHDDRFEATINKIDLNKNKPSQIMVTGTNIGGRDYDNDSNSGADNDKSLLQKQLELQFEQLQSVVYAKIVKKCGERLYWENWAADIAKIAEKHIKQITELIQNSKQARKAFDTYLAGLHKNINPSVTESDAIEMLAQHIITQPVFEALFENYSFVKNNPISQSMQGIVEILNEKTDTEDIEKLQRFYDSVRSRASNIDNVEAKQKIIIELYDKFFKTAFPKVVEKLGIVYTPIEVVDFIIRSVEDVLQKEFNRSMSDENIHILDPFTGTGTFITRLLQSGIIQSDDLERKYLKEIHANEIVLLAYYIASINIENVYHDLTNLNKEQAKKGEYYIPTDDAMYVADSSSIDTVKQKQKTSETSYTSFKGICLTDTFQLYESKELFSEIFPENSDRVIAQKKAPLRIIIGNPPYSIGQKSANDNAQNQAYEKLDNRIEETYVKKSNANLRKSAYDSYIKAFRWASERLDPKNGGIIAFVSNGAWLDANGLDGFRKCLEDEFQKIYIFNLRGNQRTSGELSRKEGGKIFGSGSRTPIAITILIKKPNRNKQKAKIHYWDIGDYLSREDKLKIIQEAKSISNKLFKANIITPNEYGDWIAKRNEKFDNFIPLESIKKFDRSSKSFFITHAIGVATNRDSWVYNFSTESIKANMKRMISFYNEQLIAYHQAKQNSNSESTIESFIDTNPEKISWTVNLKKALEKNIALKEDKESFVYSVYRPFCKEIIYIGDKLIDRPAIQKKLFPTPKHSNILICVTGLGGKNDFSALITTLVMDLNCLEAGAQCFPLHYYEENKVSQNDLFVAETDQYIKKDGLTDFILKQAKEIYGSKVNKKDIFYYVYGILHSNEYREKFSADLKKMLPRLPLVSKATDFWAFSKAGKELANLHLGYETVKPYKDVIVTGAESNNFTVHKMKFPAKDKKDTIIYNNTIAITNIPPKAYDYTVNGKSAIEWIIDRYQVTVNKDSQIKNNPNDWATEHNQPRYILDLLLSVINVSVQTVDIVATLPKVDWETE